MNKQRSKKENVVPVRFDDEERAALQILADEAGISVSETVRRLLAAEIRRRKGEFPISDIPQEQLEEYAKRLAPILFRTMRERYGQEKTEELLEESMVPSQ